MATKKLRWLMLGWLFLITMVSYMDRANLSMAVPLLMKEFHLTASQIGVVISGLTIGYTVLNFPGGFFADRFSPKKVLITAFILWSIFTVATGMVWSLTSLIIVRILFGASEGPLAPSNTKLVSNWMLPQERGTASGLWLSAMTLGVVVGGPLSGLIIQNLGWRSVFYIFGIGGFVLVALSAYILSSKPEEHKLISKEELALIKKYNTQEASTSNEGKASTGTILREILGNPLTWLLALIYFGLAALFWANLGWLPTYFVKARNSSILSSGFYSAIPNITASIGAILVGTFSDRIFKSRRTPLLIITSLIMLPAVFLAVNASSVIGALAAFSVATFADMAAIGMMWAIPMELFPKNRVAIASGFMLACGSLAGIISPIFMGYILDKTGSFNNAYYVFGIAALISALLAVPLYLKEKGVRTTNPINNSIV